MCIVSVFLELKINFFLDEVQGVPGDEVLLHTRDDNWPPQNPKILILVEKLAFNMCIVLWYLYKVNIDVFFSKF